tara:strand:+ start:496 stop:663 length:168 start_codon:yes stop_codon:yes gene_type:complete
MLLNLPGFYLFSVLLRIRVFAIKLPLLWVIDDISADTGEFLFIADDVVVVVTLQE